MTIDKRALREVAKRATKGPWTLFSDIDTKTFSIHTPRDKRCENVIKWGGFDCQPNAEANAEFIAAFNPKVALALLDEVEAAEHISAVDHEAACSLVEENEELKRRITEMESKNSNLRTIAHEQNELAIRANLDSINDAVEMDSLHKRIAETDQRNAELTAQVVPEDGRAEFESWMLKKWGRERQEYDFAMGKFLHGENYADSYTRHMWKAWTESRAAMLQSKYRDLSQPVDPQISEYEKIMLRAGWVMVPIEPTDEMIAAAMNCEDVLFNSDETFCVQFGNIYEAMLAAAPQPEGNNG